MLAAFHQLKKGTIYPPEGPGFGVVLDRDKVAKYHENHKRTGGYPCTAVDPKNLALTPTPTWPSY